jgi:hypothetical protein
VDAGFSPDVGAKDPTHMRGECCGFRLKYAAVK